MLEPLYEKPKVGGDILSFCGKCKMDLAHVVIAMVASQPARVICKTCKSEHRFRTPESMLSLREYSAKKRAKSNPSPKVTKTQIRATEYWEEKMKKISSQSSTLYNPKNKYEREQLIEHPTFGLGLIEEVKPNNKIVVLFRMGDKILIHGLK